MSDARDRMIRSAAVLIRERGVEATSFSAVLAHSRAPRGSIYHHFPGGKSELVLEATRYAGDFIAAGICAALETDDPVGAVSAFAHSWVGVLRDSGYEAGCPVVAAALEGERSPAVRDAAGAAFGAWEARLADGLRPHLAAPGRAEALATLVVAAVEGAVVLARAQQSTEPLERVAGELDHLLTGALA